MPKIPSNKSHKGISQKATVNTVFDPTVRVGFADLVALFNRSSTIVKQWVDGGYITRGKDGLYQLNEAVQGSHRYVRDHGFKRGGATKDATTARVNEARAKQIEQDTALKAKELISYSEHCAIVNLLIGGISSELDGLPATLTRDKTTRADYERKFTDVKRRLSERWERMASSSAEDDSDVDAEETA